MEKKKYSAKKFVAVVSAISVVGLATFFGVKAVRESEKEPVTPPPASSSTVPGDSSSAPESSMPELFQLEAPKISFNEKTDTLYWEEVPNSEYYIASINGKEQVVEGTLLELDLEPQSEYSFKVKAVGNGTNYLDSTWSNTISHLKQDPEVVAYNEMMTNFNAILPQLMLVEIKNPVVNKFELNSAYYKDNTLTFTYYIEYYYTLDYYGKPVENPQVETQRRMRRYKIDIEQTDANTMEELAEVSAQITTENATSVETITLEANLFTGDLTPFLNDDKLSGELRECVDQGYEIRPLYEFVSSTREDRIELMLFLRLSKGDDVRFLYNTYSLKFEFGSSNSLEYWSDYEAGKNSPLSITIVEEHELDSEKLAMYERVKEKAEASSSQTQSLSQAPEAITSKSLLDIDNINFAPNK